MTNETERRCEECEPGRNYPESKNYCGTHGKLIKPMPKPICKWCAEPVTTIYCTNCGKERSE